MIRSRFSSLLVFLVLGCILMEDALPVLAKWSLTEMVFSESEKNTDEGKQKTESEFDLFKVKDYPGDIFWVSILRSPAGKKLQVESDDIPASASRSIFSPPPELV